MKAISFLIFIQKNENKTVKCIALSESICPHVLTYEVSKLTLNSSTLTPCLSTYGYMLC